ncbi:hypothetical protein [Ureibacillus aquaedulcis]|uniref:PH domain-containing protein n=1 Tax=Ureibacillus aquaedulcis TaxID=3058421 RepID=A0ABT8GQM2_9BACL|nr:hypothetical protein [Ureibacillus sp. BA0131]MDN4493241.1 hypothetical protein [Ureibacillus sp. BA0131]
MGGPFHRLKVTRIFKMVIVFLILYFYLRSKYNMFFHHGMLITTAPILVPLLFYPIYTLYQKRKVSEYIKNNYNQTSKFIVTAFDKGSRFGYLALTDDTLYFVPKKGDIKVHPYHSFDSYGYKSIGLGQYEGTISNIGLGMKKASIQENKSPIFYIESLDGNTYYWHVKKNKLTFEQYRKINGYQSNTRKANF